MEGNILIDSGAGTTIVRKEFARSLGLQGKRADLNILVVGGEKHTQKNSRRLKFWISSADGGEEFPIEALEIDQTVQEVQPLDTKWLSTFPHLRDVYVHHSKGPIDLILGIQYSHLHAEQEVREGQPFEPIAKRTRLGWVILGSEYRTFSPATTAVACCQGEIIDMERLFDLETIGVRASKCTCPKMSAEERKVLELFESTYKVENGRCVIGLPWSKDPTELPNNYVYAEKRLQNLERSLNKHQWKKDMYREAMNEYIRNGWAEETTEVKDNVYYLPHHGVVRMDKASTPMRIVFDPAASFRGVSLNSFLFKGPSTLGDLFGILIRFREEPVAFIGDISKMFLQICLPERDTDYHRFLWRDMDTGRKPLIYRLLGVTFEDKPSPEMANFVMRKLAETQSVQYPEAAGILQHDRYMDDLIHSCASEVQAKKLMHDLDTILSTGSFKIKVWQSNIDQENKEPDDLPNSFSQGSEVKTLGVLWNRQEDQIHFRVKLDVEEQYTKRTVLSKLSTIFDPLGLAAVVTVKAKVAMQELWKKPLGWDDILPEETCREWRLIFMDLEKLNTISFPRCLKPDFPLGEPELHVFADASMCAYGACAYLLWKTDEKPSVRLVAAKVRVALLRQVTVPRLELMAALVASRLAKTLCSEMRTMPDVTLWSDSRVVLKWLCSESTSKKPFVAVRLAEIQSTWESRRWKYVPSRNNAADDLSRGVRVSEIPERWFQGPEFLKKTIEE